MKKMRHDSKNIVFNKMFQKINEEIHTYNAKNETQKYFRTFKSMEADK